MTHKPWERELGESTKAFHAFTIYRDLGPTERSLPKVCQMYASKRSLLGQMKRWSKKWQWVQRAQAYNDHLDKLRLEEHEKNVIDMKKRHLTLAKALQAKAAEKLKDLEAADFKKIPDLVKTIVEGVRLERLTLGEATEKLEGEVKEKITIRMWQPPKVDKDAKAEQ